MHPGPDSLLPTLEADGGLQDLMRRTCSLAGVRRALWIEDTDEAPDLAPCWPGIGGPRSHARALLQVLEPETVFRPAPSGCARLEALREGSLVLTRPARDAGHGLLWVELEDRAGIDRAPADATFLRVAGEAARMARRRGQQNDTRELERLAAVGEQSGALLHDLRNELTYAMLLVDGQASDPGSLAHHLRRVRNLCQAGLSPRGRAGEDDPACHSLALRPLLSGEARAVEETNLGAARPRDIHLDCPADLRVWAAASPLGRLMKNLLLNATAASPQGSPVTIRVQPRPAGQVEVCVRDRGRGMHRSRSTRLSQAGRSGRSGGTGFGSASIAACARALGTRIELASEPGRGTWIRFALGEAPAEGCAPWVLVDRDERRRDERARGLQREGIHVLPCPGPAAGLGALRGGGAARVLLARGTTGECLPDLHRTCHEQGVPLEVLGVRDPRGESAEIRG